MYKIYHVNLKTIFMKRILIFFLFNGGVFSLWAQNTDSTKTNMNRDNNMPGVVDSSSNMKNNSNMNNNNSNMNNNMRQDSASNNMSNSNLNNARTDSSDNRNNSNVNMDNNMKMDSATNMNRSSTSKHEQLSK